jgi:hypothetical protein
MKKLYYVIIGLCLFIGSLYIGVEYLGAGNMVRISRTGLTLSLDMANNDNAATPKVYDSSGFARHATSTNAQTCGATMCVFDGTTDSMSGPGTGVFGGTNVAMVFKFRPNSAAADNIYYVMMDGTAASRYGIHKADTSGNNVMHILLGGTIVESIALATYGQYWKANEDNIIVLSATSGNTNVWLNGTKILSGDATTWTAGDPITYRIGASYLGTALFAGRIYYLKVWNRLLTNAEVDTLSKDRRMFLQGPARSLIGSYSLNEEDIDSSNVYDKSGQGYHGNLAPGFSPTSTTGRSGQALYFDGSNGEIQLTAPNWRRETISVFAWVKPKSTQFTRSIITSGDTSGPATTNWGLKINSGEIQVDGDTSLSTTSGANIVLDEWNHLGFTNDGTTTKIYLNGAQVKSEAHTINNNNTTGEKIGSAGPQNIYGGIDDVRVWERALTADQVATLYKTGERKASGGVPRNELLTYLTFNAADINATQAFDMSGNGNHLACGASIEAVSGNDGNGAADFGDANQSCLAFDSIAVGEEYANLGVDGDEFSIAFWMKTSMTSSAGSGWRPNQVIVELSEQAGTGVVVPFSVGVSNRVIEIGRQDANGNGERVAGVKEINDGKWHHIFVLVMDDIGEIYIDGALDRAANFASATSDTSSGSQTMNLRIGAGSGADGNETNTFGGSIDELMVFNEALGEDEIQAVMNAGRRNIMR